MAVLTFIRYRNISVQDAVDTLGETPVGGETDHEAFVRAIKEIKDSPSGRATKRRKSRRRGRISRGAEYPDGLPRPAGSKN